jgi:hypothetical protein
VCGVVVEEASREVEVTGSNPQSRSVATLREKMRDLRLNDGDRWGGWLASGVPPIKKVLLLFIFGF